MASRETRIFCPSTIGGRGGPDAGVKRWLEATNRQPQYVSVITLAEIQKGIEVLPEGRRRAQLEEWLRQELEAWFWGRILPVDRRVAARWARC